jgi:hypothetical protein
MVIGSNQSRRHHQHVRGGAIPLGQHQRRPDQVMPLPPAPVSVPDVVPPPRFTYPDLPRPATPARGCCRCDASAILVDPATTRGFCSSCWMQTIIQRTMD